MGFFVTYITHKYNLSSDLTLMIVNTQPLTVAYVIHQTYTIINIFIYFSIYSILVLLADVHNYFCRGCVLVNNIIFNILFFTACSLKKYTFCPLSAWSSLMLHSCRFWNSVTTYFECYQFLFQQHFDDLHVTFHIFI